MPDEPTANGRLLVLARVNGRHRGFDPRLWWDLVWSDRAVDVTGLDLDQDVFSVDLRVLRQLGVRARDVLGDGIAARRTVEWARPMIKLVWPGIATPFGAMVDIQPLVDVAVGGAVLSLRTIMPGPFEDLGERGLVEQMRGIAARGAWLALRRVIQEVSGDPRQAGEILSL